MRGPEAKLYQKLKKITPTICWNRIENLSLIGMPDTLAYTKYNHFFTETHHPQHSLQFVIILSPTFQICSASNIDMPQNQLRLGR